MLTVAIARYLGTREIGLHYGPTQWNIGLEELPALDDAAAVLLKTAPVGDYSDSKLSGVQILVRWATGPGTARPGYDKAIEIRDELHGLRHITLDPGGDAETRLLWMRSDGDQPLNLGDDANGQPRWSLRFLAATTHDTALTIL